MDEQVRLVAGLHGAEQLLVEVTAALEAGDVGDLDRPAAGLGVGFEFGPHEGVVVGMEVVFQEDTKRAVDRRTRRLAGDLWGRLSGCPGTTHECGCPRCESGQAGTGNAATLQETTAVN